MLKKVYRFVLSPTGPLNRCEDDVRRFFEAAEAGVKRALKAGAKKPLMIVIPEESMPQSLLVSILGAMHALYTNIELREAVPEKAKKAEGLGVWSSCAKQMQVCLRFLQRLCLEFIFMFPDLISILDSTTCNQA